MSHKSKRNPYETPEASHAGVSMGCTHLRQRAERPSRVGFCLSAIERQLHRSGRHHYDRRPSAMLPRLVHEGGESVDDTRGEREVRILISRSVRRSVIRHHRFEDMIGIWQQDDLGIWPSVM